jgi:hypothetical protein
MMAKNHEWTIQWQRFAALRDRIHWNVQSILDAADFEL